MPRFYKADSIHLDVVEIRQRVTTLGGFMFGDSNQAGTSGVALDAVTGVLKNGTATRKDELNSDAKAERIKEVSREFSAALFGKEIIRLDEILSKNQDIAIDIICQICIKEKRFDLIVYENEYDLAVYLFNYLPPDRQLQLYESHALGGKNQGEIALIWGHLKLYRFFQEKLQGQKVKDKLDDPMYHKYIIEHSIKQNDTDFVEYIIESKIQIKLNFKLKEFLFSLEDCAAKELWLEHFELKHGISAEGYDLAAEYQFSDDEETEASESSSDEELDISSFEKVAEVKAFRESASDYSESSDSEESLENETEESEAFTVVEVSAPKLPQDLHKNYVYPDDIMAIARGMYQTFEPKDNVTEDATGEDKELRDDQSEESEIVEVTEEAPEEFEPLDFPANVTIPEDAVNKLATEFTLIDSDISDAESFFEEDSVRISGGGAESPYTSDDEPL